MYDACVLIDGGQFRFNDGMLLDWRHVPHHRFLYVERGSGTLLFAHDQVSLQEGEIFLITPGQRKVVYDAGALCAFYYIQFDLPTLLPCAPCRACHLEPTLREALIALIRVLVEYGDSPTSPQVLATAITIAIGEGNAGELVADARIQRVLRHIERHPAATLRVEQLAELAGLSLAQFRRLFHQQTGMSPKPYLLWKRMDYARRLLRMKGLRIKEAAELMGFSSVYQFSAQYRHVHGKSPSVDTE